MSEKKNAITRAAALAAVMGWLEDGYIPSDEQTVEEVAEVLRKMYAQITKPRKKSDAPSKTQIVNRNLAAAAVAAIREHGEPVTSKWICEHVNGIMTPQKCTAVMKVAIDAGEAVKNKDGKTITYAAE